LWSTGRKPDALRRAGVRFRRVALASGESRGSSGPGDLSVLPNSRVPVPFAALRPIRAVAPILGARLAAFRLLRLSDDGARRTEAGAGDGLDRRHEDGESSPRRRRSRRLLVGALAETAKLHSRPVNVAAWR